MVYNNDNYSALLRGFNSKTSIVVVISKHTISLFSVLLWLCRGSLPKPQILDNNNKYLFKVHTDTNPITCPENIE